MRIPPIEPLLSENASIEAAFMKGDTGREGHDKIQDATPHAPPTLPGPEAFLAP